MAKKLDRTTFSKDLYKEVEESIKCFPIDQLLNMVAECILSGTHTKEMGARISSRVYEARSIYLGEPR